MAAIICRVHAREVLDSRGNPTVEVEVYCKGAPGSATVGLVQGRAIVPSGVSRGRHEAFELRDAQDARFGGAGVRTAVRNVREVIGPRVIGMDAADQHAIDRRLLELDGTANKSALGANAVLGVSLAAAHAAAAVRKLPLYRHIAELYRTDSYRALAHGPAIAPHPLDRFNHPSPSMPVPMVNMISGGLHAGGNLDLQDILVMPLGAPNYASGLEWIVATYRKLGNILACRRFEHRLVADEGGFGPRLKSNQQAIAFVTEAIEMAGLAPGRDVSIALDVASTQFYEHGRYHLRLERHRSYSATEWVDRLEQWSARYPICSIEDGCAEDDLDGWRILTDRLGDRVQLIGDDLFVTNPTRLANGIARGLANAVLVKPNQIGTLSETFAVIRTAQQAGYRTIISARSGETEDVTIAHLAVATGAGQIKIGSVARGERLAKYNELLRIEEQLTASA